MSDQKDWYDLAVEEAKHENLSEGTLSALSGFVYWQPSRPEITLDGDFSAQELRRFADHMDRYTVVAKGIER